MSFFLFILITVGLTLLLGPTAGLLWIALVMLAELFGGPPDDLLPA